MTANFRTGGFALAILLAPELPADAAPDCPQGHAVYRDGSGKFEIQIQPKTPAHIANNPVELVELATAAHFDGIVAWNMGFAVPNIQINYACGSGAEANQCSYGAVVYTLAVENGRPEAAPALPADFEPAASTLLFPDLSRHWHYNARAHTAAIPDDVFRFARCHRP